MRNAIVSVRALILFLSIVSWVSPSGAQDSVADAARRNRSKEARTATKRVWTNDDISSTNAPALTTTPEETRESVSETIRKFRLLGKEELAVAVLTSAGVNVQFPNRKDWEQRLFDAKQSWLFQLDRAEGHKDANKDSRDEELKLALGAQRIFERIEEEGIKQARAVNDPMLKARLEYERQQDFCKQTSGELLERCLASLDQLRLKMQREGTW